MQRLFVYGTLSPDKPNHDVLADIPGRWEAATLEGNLLDEGWGVEMGCPGIVPCNDGVDAEVFLLSSAHLSGH